jgi:hypothetical protein
MRCEQFILTCMFKMNGRGVFREFGGKSRCFRENSIRHVIVIGASCPVAFRIHIEFFCGQSALFKRVTIESIIREKMLARPSR